MANQHRNEMEFTIGSQKILLRPTFENISNLESDIGSVSYLSYKFGKGFNLETMKIDQDVAIKNAPSMTETAKIIFHCQAEKNFTIEEVFDLCQDEGIKICMGIVAFLGKIASGNKKAKELNTRQKKNSPK